MARHGRRFPLTTQSHALWRTVPVNPLSGAATFILQAVGAIDVIPSVVTSSGDTAAHRMRTVLVPPLLNFDEVQRHLQRAMDEVARAVNPVRSIADGGTGITQVTGGSLMAGTDSDSMETVPIGDAHATLVSDGAMPMWSLAPPKWRRFTVAYTDFNIASTTGTKSIYSLPARDVVHAAVIKHSASFTGGVITAYTLSVGVSGNATKYTPALNVFAAPSNTGFAQSPTALTSVENMGAATSVLVTATSTGANLNAATAGAAEVWLLVAALPTT